MARSALLVLVVVSALAACGVKPEELDPPAGDAPLDYPRSYPTY